MKNSIKNKLFESIDLKMAESYPDMSESNRRKIGFLIQGICMEIMAENIEGLANSHASMIMELETHKKLFKDHIDAIQKGYGILMDTFKKNGIVSIQHDPRKNKNVMRGKTTVVTEMVEFLNYLNDLTIEFYEKVYKIESEKDSYGIQTTLF